MVYLSLFLVAFVSATLFPVGSEVLLIYDLSQNYSTILLWLFATMGNMLGSLFNYWLGLKGEHFLKQRDYLSSEKMAQAHRYFEKWGGWILLLSWMPIIGDPLTFVAGVLKYDLKKFIWIVFVAKGVRYSIIIGGYAWGIS
ncbi:MAG: DedA family protein [Sulfurovum sp.]|nr:DedA family protein [Sulfurovum sp.]MCB4748490.1 DedA family protein [Sulfurovum sp.]MCB4775970.1 DedA family protein [Sulfurovum sp.]